MGKIGRRELFKRVVKILPILVLSIVPISPIFSISTTDCNDSCKGGCKGVAICPVKIHIKKDVLLVQLNVDQSVKELAEEHVVLQENVIIAQIVVKEVVTGHVMVHVSHLLKAEIQ